MPRILIIEEEREARDATRCALRSLGHDVVAVEASAALVLLSEDRFDVVVAGFEPPRRADRAHESLAVPEIVCLPQPLSAGAVVEAVGELEQRAAIQKTLDVAHRASAEADLG